MRRSMSTNTQPDYIGPYRVLRLLGRGGFGSVFLAEQSKPMRREVAVKVLNPGMDVEELRARFRIERETLNIMKHPGIAMLLDAGVTEDDQPYFAMEYVPGVPIKEFADSKKLSLPERLELFRSVCDAVQHAHTKGVIHRDLTANNVMVVDIDGRPSPKIIDFGIAKSLGGSLDLTQHTIDGQTMGTPAYMSPEQARGDIDKIDTRTDIYALGVQLYYLLTDTLPFTEQHLRDAGVRILQMICEDEPERPSTRIARVGAAQGGRTTVNRVRGDLDWIAAKAMAKNREERYPSVAALSEDVRRYLANEPVSAGPPTTWYRLRKTIMRYRGLFTAAALLLLSLVAGLVVSLTQYFQSEANAQTAQKHLGRFNHLSDVLLLETLHSEFRELGAARPANRTRMLDWLQRADGLLARRAQIDIALAHGEGEVVEADESELRAQRFLRRELSGLITELDAFSIGEQSEVQNVRARLQWANEVVAKTVDAHRDAWGAASQRVAADRRFADLDLIPQIGLVPLGPDPDSSFEEFAVLRSGTVPRRDEASGQLLRDQETGIVLVLLPGGDFEMGSLKDPSSARHDPSSRRRESWFVNLDGEWVSRLVPVTLAPFLIGKFELTRAQWLRMSRGSDPSWTATLDQVDSDRYEITPMCPVENVKGTDGAIVIDEYGLNYPTEAQWEYSCRGGTDTPWFSGFEEDSLAGYANLADITAREEGVRWGNVSDATLEDGFVYASPVGSYKPNKFGLYDMHGNVLERCRDAYATLDPNKLTGPDAGRAWVSGKDTHQVARGGGYQVRAKLARCSYRWQIGSDTGSVDVGIRPVRALQR